MTERGATEVAVALGRLRDSIEATWQKMEPTMPLERDVLDATAKLDEYLTNALPQDATLDVVAVASSQPHFIVGVNDRRHTDLVAATIPQDIDSGQLDAYRTSVGVAPRKALNSELSRCLVIHGLLMSLESREQEHVSRQHLLKAGKARGFHRQVVNHELEQLKRRGLVAEVEPGQFATLNRTSSES